MWPDQQPHSHPEDSFELHHSVSEILRLGIDIRSPFMVFPLFMAAIGAENPSVQQLAVGHLQCFELSVAKTMIDTLRVLPRERLPLGGHKTMVDWVSVMATCNPPVINFRL